MSAINSASRCYHSVFSKRFRPMHRLLSHRAHTAGSLVLLCRFRLRACLCGPKVASCAALSSSESLIGLMTIFASAYFAFHAAIRSATLGTSMPAAHQFVRGLTDC